MAPVRIPAAAAAAMPVGAVGIAWLPNEVPVEVDWAEVLEDEGTVMDGRLGELTDGRLTELTDGRADELRDGEGKLKEGEITEDERDGRERDGEDSDVEGDVAEDTVLMGENDMGGVGRLYADGQWWRGWQNMGSVRRAAALHRLWIMRTQPGRTNV